MCPEVRDMEVDDFFKMLRKKNIYKCYEMIKYFNTKLSIFERNNLYDIMEVYHKKI